jgi:hypothetical protein
MRWCVAGGGERGALREDSGDVTSCPTDLALNEAMLQSAVEAVLVKLVGLRVTARRLLQGLSNAGRRAVCAGGALPP